MVKARGSCVGVYAFSPLFAQSLWHRREGVGVEAPWGLEWWAGLGRVWLLERLRGPGAWERPRFLEPIPHQGSHVFILGPSPVLVLLVGEGCPCPNSAWVLSRSSRQRACGASGWGAAPHGEGAQGWRPGVGAPEKEVSSQGRPPARGVASLPGQGARQSVDRPARRGVHQGVDRPAGRAVQDLRCTHRLPHPGFGCPGILTVGTRTGTRQRAGSLLQCKIENVY